MISIIIVDDQRLLREGLQTLLQTEEGLEIVALCANGKEALEVIQEYRPNVVLMDIKMSGIDGIDAMRRIKREYPLSLIYDDRWEQEQLKQRIRHIKANRSTSRKLFKITEHSFNHADRQYARGHHFMDLTTCKHYPGKHRLSVVINGIELAAMDFYVTAAAAEPV